ncbi:hypothetical protein CPB83DRAFT_841485 [Crepidotus variabilis]|uniref:Uncharacterized protein n=1 Tax=Crepidotus variabilis TaxID=179855 RepID=A0A9P6JX09_9AGAR|nr:hypothetical protein CPB83DRAFT_841485 [Crepidotus variabilis]
MYCLPLLASSSVSLFQFLHLGSMHRGLLVLTLLPLFSFSLFHAGDPAALLFAVATRNYFVPFFSRKFVTSRLSSRFATAFLLGCGKHVRRHLPPVWQA